jgi:hypothetical protein
MTSAFLLLMILALLSVTMIMPVIGYHDEKICLTFESRDMGITIDRPCEWTVEELPEVISIISPDHDLGDRVLEKVDISTYPTFDIDISQFIDFLETDFYPQNLVSFEQLHRSDAVIINGLESYLLVYKYYENTLERDVQAMDIAILEGDSIYLLTYTADSSTYSRYLPIVKQMVDSFKIVSPPVLGSDSDLTGGIGSSEGSDLTGGIGSSEGSNLTGGLSSSEVE